MLAGAVFIWRQRLCCGWIRVHDRFTPPLHRQLTTNRYWK